MTEPTEPTESAESAESEALAEPTEAADSRDAAPPDIAEPDAADPDAADPDADQPKEAEATPTIEAVSDAPASELVTLPDESNSRTSELAARLRQSALAQVEAARAAKPVVAEPAEAEAADPTVEVPPPATQAIPALDDPRPRARDRQPAPELVSEPIAVAAAAMAEAEVTSDHGYSSGPLEPESSRLADRVRLATIAAAVLALAAVAVLIAFARTASHNHAINQARTAALAAAKTETALALSYDYRTLDADFAAAEKGMSRAFRAKYAQTASTDVTPLAMQSQAVTAGAVTAAGVIAATPSTVRVLVFAVQTTTNKNIAPKSRLDSSSIEVTMVKQDGHWLIDDLQPF